MTATFDRFTKCVRQALTTAQSEAASRQCEAIYTEHLLLGLLLQEQGAAAKILQTVGVTLDLVQAQIAPIAEPGDDTNQPKPTLAAPAKRAIELAVATARIWGHTYVGTEHLLVGLLLEGQGRAYQVLHALGITVDQVAATLSAISGRDGAA